MRRFVELPISVVRIYACLILIFSLLGNDFLAFRYSYFAVNPYRVLIIIAPLILLLAPKIFWKNLSESSGRNYVFFLALLFVYSSIGGIWSKAYLPWIFNLFFLCGGLLTTILLIGCIDGKRSIMLFLRVAQISAIIVCLGGAIEIFTGHYFFVDEWTQIAYLNAKEASWASLNLPVFSMRNVNDFSAFLFFASIISMVLFFMDTAKKKIIDALTIILFVFFILVGESRSICFALLLAFLIILSFYLYNKFKPGRIIIYSIVAILAVVFVSAVVICVQNISYESIIERESERVRIGLIRNVWHFFSDVWYRGLGWGGIEYYNINYPVYTDPAGPPNLHNWFLEILCSSGIFIFAAYMWVYIQTSYISIKNMFVEIDIKQKIALAVAIMMICFVPISIASSSFISDHWFWSVWALIFCIYSYMKKSNDISVHS